MAEPAIRRLSLAEFLRWEDGTDTRWELVDGEWKERPPFQWQDGTIEAMRFSPDGAEVVVVGHTPGIAVGWGWAARVRGATPTMARSAPEWYQRQ